MENQQSKIDEIFRQRLHDAEVPPPPIAWPAVEHELRKRRRRVLILWLFAFGTVTALVGLWKADSWSNFNPGTVLNPASESKQNSPQLKDSEQALVSPDIAPPSTVVENLSEQGSGSTSGNTLQPALIADNQHSGAIGAGRRVNASVTKGKRSETGIVLNSTLEQAFPDEITTLKGIAEAKNPNSNQRTESLIDTKNLQIGQQGLLVSGFKPGTPAVPSTFKALSRRKKEQPKVCYDFSRHSSAWLVDVYAGPSLAQRSLTSRFDDQPYLNQRLATEHKSTAYNAGLRASLMFNNNFLIRTGLNYDQISEVFEFIDPAYTKYRIEVTVLSNGMTHIDTVGVDYGENYLKTYNRYSMLDLPLLVGMEMRKGRSGISINAGISANLLFETSGVIIDPQTHEPARFGPIPEKPKGIGPKSTLSQEVFRANVGLSASASIQYYWHLSPHFRVFVEPSFRQVLRPVTVENHPVEQRYSILGLRLGATRIF